MCDNNLINYDFIVLFESHLFSDEQSSKAFNKSSPGKPRSRSKRNAPRYVYLSRYNRPCVKYSYDIKCVGSFTDLQNPILSDDESPRKKNKSTPAKDESKSRSGDNTPRKTVRCAYCCFHTSIVTIHNYDK